MALRGADEIGGRVVELEQGLRWWGGCGLRGAGRCVCMVGRVDFEGEALFVVCGYQSVNVGESDGVIDSTAPSEL